MARQAHMTPAWIRASLDLPDRTVRRLAAQDADPALISAIRLQLELRARLADPGPLFIGEPVLAWPLSA